MGKQSKRVVAIEDKKQESMLHAAKMHAEAACRANPSVEAKTWADEQFDTKPAWVKDYGDLMAEAYNLAFKDFHFGYLTKEAVRRSSSQLKTDLGYEEATAAERLLIEHVVLCHVRLGMIEQLYSSNVSGSYRLDIAEHWEKRLTLAQKRFTRAMTTFTRVRELMARADKVREAARYGGNLSVLKQTG